MKSFYHSLQNVLFYWIILCITNVVATINFENQAKLSSTSGHLYIIGAAGKNISIMTNGKGCVNINNINLLETILLAKEATEKVSYIETNQLGSIKDSITTLQDVLLGENGLQQRLISVEAKIRNGSDSTSKKEISRSLTSKIESLQKSVRKLTTLLTTNECSSNPCQHGGTCQDLFNGFQCLCTDAWMGPYCNIDVNECARFYNTDLGCQNGAECKNTPGSYECICAPGWFGLHCTRSSNDCTSSSSKELCGNGVCVNKGKGGGYTCICDQGWTTNSTSPACTEDVDECAKHTFPCSRNPLVKCENTRGSFTCGPCPSGYEGNGFYCIDIDECQTNNGGCSIYPRVQCINTMGARICSTCPSGYTGDGITCTESVGGVCSVNNGGCHQDAICSEYGQGRVQCICRPGYVGPGFGLAGCVLSVPTTSICSGNACVHGSCIANNNTSYTCVCFAGYTGRYCDSTLNPCINNPCQNGASCFPRIDGSFTCECTYNFRGRLCEEEAAECGDIFNNEKGVLKYPPTSTSTAPKSTVECSWTITTNETKVINITVIDYQPGENLNCKSYLEFRDGSSDVDTLITRLCTPVSLKLVASNGYNMYIRLKSMPNLRSQIPSFTLNWTSSDPVCGGMINFDSHGSFSSPGYPGFYPDNRDCYWRFIAPLSKRIQFHFFSFRMEYHQNCSFDFLEIHDGLELSSPLLQKYCHNSTPPALTTSGPNALVYFHTDSSYGLDGFQISYTAVEGIPGCVGILTGPNGDVVFPLEGQVYQGDVNCEWKIQLPVSERVKITFTSFITDNTKNCLNNKLEVREGNAMSSTLMARYCTTDKPSQPIVSTRNEVLLVLSMKSSTTSPLKFRLTYESLCGGEFMSPTGIIKSPYYPNHYPSSRTCVYIIVQPLNKAISLSIQDLDIVSPTQKLCNVDYLEIRDGENENATLIKKLCDRNANKTFQSILSTHNYLYIKFKTELSNIGRGFIANYSTVDITCGGILKSSSGMIESPKYPDEYPPLTKCKWIISVDPGYIISLTFITFQLENHARCIRDYVEIFDNSTVPGQIIGKYCGNKLPPAITSSGNRLSINFRTDFSVSADGFQANYIAKDARKTCTSRLTTSSGVIKSPNYPDKYPNMKECEWIISANMGYQITLNVTDFNLEKGNSCSYDYLEIRDGGYATSPLFGKYCGTTIPEIITSTSNQLYLKFYSDSSRPKTGFLILYDTASTGCGGTLTGSTGQIASPNYMQPSDQRVECFWKIIVSSGNAIRVNILDLDLRTVWGVSQCGSLDFVEFYDGDSSTSKSLGRYCRENEVFTIRSSANKMFIKYKVSGYNSNRGFLLRYLTDCNNTLNGFRGVIESPNFPHSNAGSLNCFWTIDAPLGNNISITFTHFSFGLPMQTIMSDFYTRSSLLRAISLSNKTENCSNSGRVEVTEGADFYYRSYGIMCGNTLPGKINSITNSIRIHLVSNSQLPNDGFRLEWSVLGCGGLLEKPMGSFMSPRYPNHYPNSIQCDWHISVSWQMSVEITIRDFDFENFDNCTLDSLTIYGGPDTSAPELAKLCHTQKSPLVVTTSGNHAFVRFLADSSFSSKGFYASYRTVNSTCGGLLKSPTGTFHTSKYPQNYGPTDDCIWLIEVPATHLINLTIVDFNTRKNKFVSDWLTVYDGDSYNSTVLLHHAGNELPNPRWIISTSNKLYVRFTSLSGAFQAKGFLAKYSIACGARILTNGTGVITNHDALTTIMDPLNCSWVIMSYMPDAKITLTITHMDLIPGGTDDSSCSDHNVTIIDGEDSTDPVRNTLCGYKIPPSIISSGAAIRIEYYAANKFQIHGSFIATYSVFTDACGGNLTSQEGEFASPRYPNSYPNNAECVWQIQTAPGHKVSLAFTAFDLESSPFCNNDYVEVRQKDSMGQLLGVFCGSSIPSNATIASSLWIKFKSDNSSNSKTGFSIYYTLTHSNEISGTSGQIASPFYPMPYNRNGQFSWRVSVSHGMAIRIAFDNVYMNTFSDETCTSYVKVYDGYDETAPILSTVCDSIIPTPFKSTGNLVYITFETSPLSMGVYFLLSWSQEIRTVIVSPTATTPKPGICDYDIVMSLSSSNDSNWSYQLASPGYPYGYDKLLKCTWNIHTEMESHIEFVFTAVDLESRPTCYGDSVTISTSSVESTEMKQLAKICELPSTRRYYGSNHMKIEFSTDYYDNKTGFAGIAYVVCGGSVSGPSGVLEATNTSNWFGSSLVTCQWNITVRAGRKINITFVDFNLPPASVTLGQTVCGNEYVLLRNGLSIESPYLGNGRYCGTSPPFVPLSSQNKVYVKFSSLRNKKFKMIYEEEPIECGGEVILKAKNNFITITSPNFPNVPPPYTECTWIIVAPLGEKIRFDLLDINLQKSDFCNKEYLEIRDGASEDSLLLINRQCSSNIGNSIESNGNYLYVKYYTSVDEPDNGFRANISIGKCGGVYRGMEGSIVSPNYPNNYSPNMQCTYRIITAEDTFITISFDQINLNKVRYSVKKEKTDDVDTIMVYNVQKAQSISGKPNNDTDTLLATLVGAMTMAPVNTTRNEALIVFNSYTPRDTSLSYYAKSDLRFMISYTAHESSCRENIEGISGTIESPSFYKSNPWYCTWKITVPFGRRVTLEFLKAFSKITDDASLNQEMEWIISNQRISIYSDFERKTRLAYFIDSLPIRRIIKSSSNMMFISYQVFQSSGQSTLKFKYSSNEPAVCGGRLSGNGTIRSPGMNESEFYSCSWDITTAEIDKTLVLEVSGNLGSLSVFECQEYGSPLIIKTQELSDVHTMFCSNIGDQPSVVLMPVHLTKIQAYRNNINNNTNVNFSINYYERSCGGLLRGPNDNISMGFYAERTYCAWAIRYPPGNKLKITFGLIDMDASCIKNKLLIYNGPYRSAPLARNICGNMRQDVFITSSNNLWIEFHSLLPANKVTFNVSISTEQSACGGEEHDVQGVLTSPGYPDKQYPNNAECEWIITVQQSYHIGLSFVGRFFLEDSVNCVNDFVQIFDYNFKNNEWKSLGSVCGRNIPPVFNTTSHKMKVLFRSNNDVQSDGFKAMWNVNCGGIYLDDGGTIYSPNYPSVYPSNSFCNYTIYAPGKFIDLEFTAFQLESSTWALCDMDNVTIYTQNWNKQSNLIGSYCGSSKPPNKRLKNAAYIIFKSDFMLEKTGFVMKYSTYSCGGNISAPTSISSPKESNNYFPSSNCTWYITAPVNQLVTLRFWEFHLEGSDCEYDRVTIWSGLKKNQSNAFPPLCGDLSDRPPIVKSTNNQMVVEFISDESSHYPGFTAEVIFTYGESAGCGYSKLFNSTDDNYIIKSPKLDQINVCMWQFRAPVSHSIKLIFESFTMDTCNSTTNKSIGCGSCNHISIHDGLGEKDEIIETICGVPTPAIISSSGNSLTLVYYLNDLKQNTNFTIKAENALQTPICGPNSLIATSVPQTLNSPGSPSTGYPPNIRCKWTITAASSTMISDISIRIMDIDMDESPKCTADRLEIKSSTPSLSSVSQKFCSKAHSIDTYYWSDSVQILFITDDIYTHKSGFKLQYQIGGCSRNYTEGQGRIYTYEYGLCESVIFAPSSNQTISLYFYSFYIYTKNDDCHQSNITVYDGSSKDSPLLTTICGRSKPNPIFSTGPSLRIILNPGLDTSSSSAQYDISYTTTDQGRGCGGRLFNVHGIISSPLYPSSFRNKTTCRWDLSVPHPNNIKLKFKVMDIGSASSCNTDYLEVSDYDSESNTEKFISKYCGGDRPSTHISYTNAVVIRYVTSVNNAGSGWMITFDSVAPGDTTDYITEFDMK